MRSTTRLTCALLAIAALLSLFAPACSCNPGETIMGFGSSGENGGTTGFPGSGGTGGVGGACAPPTLGAGAPATWSHAFTGQSGAQVSSIAVTPGGEVIIAGSYSGTMDAGGGPLKSQGDSNLFVVKLDAVGNHVWSRSFGGAGTTISGPVAVDAAGNIVLAASFSGVIDFGAGMLDGGVDTGLALAALDPAGNVLWAQGHGTNATPDALALDAAGNIFLTAATGPQGTLARYDATGTHVWSLHLAGPIGFLALDGAGDVVVAEGSGTGPIVVRKLDATGAGLWTQTFMPAGLDSGMFVAGVAVAPSGDIAFTGSLTGSVDFGGGPVKAVHHGDAALVVLDASGKHVASRVYLGAGLPLANDTTSGTEGASVAFTPSGGLFVSTISSPSEILGSVELPAGVGVLEVAADASPIHDHTNAAWLVDTTSFGSGPATAALAVDALGGGVVAWGAHQGACPPTLDFGQGALGPAVVFVARFAP